ncbi:MAG: DUF1638 domain-containing protein [Verrucomicrobia bacterium]|jgi:hypothetical protein|nr:DUF1638 domain-containing protein [Verrucomicrobiota bacterium]MBT7067682.1 DUF1638 domain-containing protein [Verrucomicrobiota bacterium]MBT7699783.1 DUF1638 domain-containing protein [Verrucomicrobiota bacterium]
MPDKLCLLVCTIIRPEVDAVLAHEAWENVIVRSFPARCGRTPLSSAKLEALTTDVSHADKIEVLGSSCLCGLNPHADDATHIHRLSQCLELLAPAECVASHLETDAYLLSPGWLRDWRKHVSEWGFVRSQARSFFKEFAKHLVLLDTGIDPESQARLQAFATFVNLPHSVDAVGLDTLRSALHDLVEE